KHLIQAVFSIYCIGIFAGFFIFIYSLIDKKSYNCTSPLLGWLGIFLFIIVPALSINYFLFIRTEREIDRLNKQTEISSIIPDHHGSSPISDASHIAESLQRLYSKRLLFLLSGCVSLVLWFVMAVIGATYSIKERKCPGHGL